MNAVWFISYFAERRYTPSLYLIAFLYNLWGNNMEIIAKNIKKSFKEKTLFEDLSFLIPSGSITALTGNSGSGKTTLLNCIGSLENIDDGDIIVGNTNVRNASSSTKRKLLRSTYGFLFQNYGLIENWSIERNLKIGLRFSKLSAKSKKQAMKEALETVHLSKIDLKTKIYTLSGGEQQRVALARILLKSAKVILSDEPSAALDDNNTQMVIDTFRDLTKRGKTVIIATHDHNVVDCCNNVISL